jgi:hypothetical protein
MKITGVDAFVLHMPVTPTAQAWERFHQPVA